METLAVVDRCDNYLLNPSVLHLYLELGAVTRSVTAFSMLDEAPELSDSAQR